MKKSLLLKGMIKGIDMSGGILIKTSDTHIYFDVPIGSEIDNDEKLKIANNAFKDQFGIGMKIRKVEK